MRWPRRAPQGFPTGAPDLWNLWMRSTSLAMSESSGNRAMTLSTWWGGKVLQSTVRALARESASGPAAWGTDPKAPPGASSSQRDPTQAERPGSQPAPGGRAHGSAGCRRGGRRSLCGAPGRYPPCRPGGLRGLWRPGGAGGDGEGPGTTQSGQSGLGARPQPGPRGGARRGPGSSLRTSLEKPPPRVATSAARALPRCASSPPAPRQASVCARSSSATASCAWCGLSGW